MTSEKQRVSTDLGLGLRLGQGLGLGLVVPSQSEHQNPRFLNDFRKKRVSTDLGLGLGLRQGLGLGLVKALVWFWWIDEILSANLVYQSDYEIGSNTLSD